MNELDVDFSSFFEEFSSFWVSGAVSLDSLRQKVIDTDEIACHFDSFQSLYRDERRRGTEVNVWKLAGLKRDEVRNTAVLSWWLDCQGSHGLGSILLESFLSLAPELNLACPNGLLLNRYKTRAESLPLGEVDNRIDIEIKSKYFLLFIEVKIDASEGDQQLERYKKLLFEKSKLFNVKKNALIYLTPSGVKCEAGGVISFSWRQVAGAFRKAKIPEGSEMVKQVLFQFCEHIEGF